jgi:hypothetical protein
VRLLAEGAEILVLLVWQRRTSRQVHVLYNPAAQLLRAFHSSSEISRKKGVRSVRLRLIFAADSATERTGLKWRAEIFRIA